MREVTSLPKNQRIILGEAPSQAEPQIMFRLWGKNMGFYAQRKGNNYMRRRKKFLLVLMSYVVFLGDTRQSLW